MSEAFLPSVRQLVARQLRKKGMSQNKISALLGVTQASVSVYLSSDPKKAYGSLASLNVPMDEADKIAARLSSAVAAGPVEGVRALMSVWTGLLGQGLVCDAHRVAYPSLATCDVCMLEYGRRHGESERSVAEVSEAVKLLERSSEFVTVMPEVSVNIASAAPGATSPADIIAVPGRVVKVRGRAKALLPPEAGASVHMAKVLLLAMSRQPEYRACINLRYDRRMEGLLRRAGLRTLAIRGMPKPGVEDPTFTALESKLKVTRGGFDALVEEGGSGIEPNVYLFAKGAREAAELAIRLAKAYSAG
jgi:XRE family transcriptional regulator, thiamine biosynthesis regulator